MSIENDKSNDDLSDHTIEALNDLLELTDNPQDFLHNLLLPPSNTNKEHDTKVDALRSISKILFSRVENLASLYEKIERSSTKRGGMGKSDTMIDDEDDEEDEDLYPLSGLSELYTGSNEEVKDEDDDDDDDNEEFKVDSETIFNQVDVQNTSLVTMVKKTIRKLSKKIEKNDGNDDGLVRLLNMEDMNSEEEKEMNDSDGDDDDDDDDESSIEKENSSEDEETQRIRERMERSMAAMDGSSEEEDSDDDEVDNDKTKPTNKTSRGDDEPVDPSREELYDGFFDLHEMENFADEEEEMLPDAAFGEAEPDNYLSTEDQKKSLPHIRAREGNEDNDDDDEDDEFNELEKKVETSVRRKRYRDDEDINALAEMYGDTNQYSDDEEDEDEEDDVINMTAADFFGPPRKPSKQFLQKSKNKNKKKVTSDNDDDDSWNDHDFSAEGKDWRDEESDDDGNEEESNNENQDDEDDKDLNAESDGDEEEEENTAETNKHVSNYSKRNHKLEEMTKELEKDLLAEKPWQMSGETKGTQRPTNSLLEVTPTFEVATKLAPIITVDHTVSIEEMIKRRILAEDWDDVVPRELPDIGLNQRKGELPEVSQEKSKLSLGELYEREYLKKVTGYDADAVEKETEEEKAKNEMKMLFANLCSKLDALSNYHFAPRPVADEAEVKTSATPAVAMEEVLPLHVSDAQAMAPEEIFNQKKGRDGILRGESEMDQVRIEWCRMFLLLILSLLFESSKIE